VSTHCLACIVLLTPVKSLVQPVRSFSFLNFPEATVVFPRNAPYGSWSINGVAARGEVASAENQA
jgi:hypothetical protein